MARRGKTKVGGGPRQDTMMRAQETGRASIERAESQQLQQIQQGGQQGTQNIMRGAAMADQKVAQDKDRAQQEGQFQQKMSLEAADRGLQEQDPRTQQLQADMERGAKQTSKPLEFTGTKYEQSDARVAGEAAAEETKGIQKRTAQLNAQTALQRAIAENAGDDKVEAASERVVKQIDDKIKIIDKLQTGQFSSVNMDSLFAAMKDNPDSALQEAMSLGPAAIEGRADLQARVIQAVKNEAGSMQIRKLAIDGDMNGLDDRLPYMREFRETRDQISQFAQGNLAFAEMAGAGQEYIEGQQPGTQGGADFANRYQGFTSRKEVSTFLNRTSASIMMRTQQLNAMARQENDASGGTDPNQPPMSQMPQGEQNAPGAPAPGPEQAAVPKPKHSYPGGRPQQDFQNQFGTKF